MRLGMQIASGILAASAIALTLAANYVQHGSNQFEHRYHWIVNLAYWWVNPLLLLAVLIAVLSFAFGRQAERTGEPSK